MANSAYAANMVQLRRAIASTKLQPLFHRRGVLWLRRGRHRLQQCWRRDGLLTAEW